MNLKLFLAILSTIAAMLALIPAFTKSEKPVQQTSVVEGNNNTVNQFIQPPGNPPSLPPTINNISITNNNSTISPDAATFIARQAALVESQKKDVDDYKYQARAWKANAQAWQAAYINLIAPNAILMLGDLAQFYQVIIPANWFIDRWAARIEDAEQRRYYVNEFMIKFGWALYNNGKLSITEDGINVLRQGRYFPFQI